MPVTQPGRPPTWLWLFGDIWFAIAILPAIGSAYLIAHGRVVSGVAVLVVWIAAFWAVASAMDRRRYARRWIILAGGVLVYAVSLLVFTLIATP